MHLPLQILEPIQQAMPHIDDTIKQGICVYLVGLTALTAWEELVVPYFGLTDRANAFTQQERDIEWITPMTADTPVPLPTLESLRTRERQYVGKRDGIPQFIALDVSQPVVPGVCEIDATWSEFYDDDVYIFKQK